MRNLFFILCLLGSGTTMAQFSTNGYFLQQVGFEQNPLRQAISLDTTEEFFPQAMALSKVYFRLRVKKNTVEWGITPRMSYQYFLGNSESNYFKVDGQQYFCWRLNKHWRILQETDWRTRRRRGADEEEAFFFIPRSYQQKSVSLGLEWDPNRDWEVIALASIGKRSYMLPEDREGDNFYRFTEFRVDIERKSKDQLLNSIQSWIQWQKRNWLLEEFEEDEEEPIRFRETQLHQFEIGAEMDIQLSDDWSGGPLLLGRYRSSERSVQNYALARVGFQLQWETKKLEVNFNTAISYKYYPALFPVSDQLDPLQYWYFSSQLAVTWNLSPEDELALTVGWQSRSAISEVAFGSNLGSYQRSFVNLGYKHRF